ncbi:tripartite tricarboxylate transporter TctB family protein, partial [Methylobacterium hispanicum]
MDISRRTGEIATSAATALIGLTVCYGALENGIAWEESGPSSGFFPFCVGCLIVLGSAVTGAQALLRPVAG